MNLAKRRRFHPVWRAVFAISLLSGCSSEPQLAGSCATGVTEDGVKLCIDYYDDVKLEQKRQVCGAVMRGTWSERACATDAALGGCRAGSNVVWFLPSPKHPDVTSARMACESQDREFLAAPG
jgi:hypothetical protein